MKPDDNTKLPADQRPFRILIISGSNRRQYNCPGVDSKSRMLMLRMAANLPQEWEIDYEDGKFRACGYKPPFAPIQELKTGIRSWKLRFGRSPKYSSPWIQKKEDLNKDVTWNPGKGEGKKLREK